MIEQSYRHRYYASATYRRARARERRHIFAGAVVVALLSIAPLVLLYLVG